MATIPIIRAGTLDLAGTWRLTGMDARGGAVTCSIAVPGGVHSALLAAGVMPDVYFGRNEAKTLWVALHDWTVGRTFTATVVSLTDPGSPAGTIAE